MPFLPPISTHQCRWLTVFSVLVVLALSGSWAKAASCHQSERPEFAAFEFLDSGSKAQSQYMDRPTKDDYRVGPQPCSGSSDAGASSEIQAPCSGLPSCFTQVEPVGQSSTNWQTPDPLFPSQVPPLLDRPPRLPNVWHTL